MTTTDVNDDLRDLAWVRALCATGANATLRRAANLTIREVGTAVGVGEATIHRWESGKTKPTGRRALAYARALRSIEVRS